MLIPFFAQILYESKPSVKPLVTEKKIFRPRLDDLAEGDIHLANLSAYAKHLVFVEDLDRAAHNARPLDLTVINAFQQAGITNVQWCLIPIL